MDFFIKLLILIKLSIFVTNHCVFTAIVDRYYNKRLNSLQDFQFNRGFNKYYKSDKCEIKIVTNGVCSVNNHLVKPRILVNHPFSDHSFREVPGIIFGFTKMSFVNDFIVYFKPRNEERVRNMMSIKIEQDKANNLVDQFLVKFKEHFGPEIDPMIIKEFGKFKLKKIGESKTELNMLLHFIGSFVILQIYMKFAFFIPVFP